MIKKIKLNLSVVFILMLGFVYHLEFYNITKATEDINSETSSVASDKSKEKEITEQNNSEQIEKNNTSREIGEIFHEYYKYTSNEGLVRDWEDNLEKIIIVTVRVWIDPAGNLAKSEIAKSCGNSEYDQLVMDSIKKRIFKPSNDVKMRIGIIEIEFPDTKF